MSKPKTLHIVVKQEHIDEGIPGDELSCPIALAVAEQYPELKTVEVCSDTLIVSNEIAEDYTLPEVAQEFIASFDYELEVKPFEFDAELFDEDQLG